MRFRDYGLIWEQYKQSKLNEWHGETDYGTYEGELIEFKLPNRIPPDALDPNDVTYFVSGEVEYEDYTETDRDPEYGHGQFSRRKIIDITIETVDYVNRNEEAVNILAELTPDELAIAKEALAQAASGHVEESNIQEHLKMPDKGYDKPKFDIVYFYKDTQGNSIPAYYYGDPLDLVNQSFSDGKQITSINPINDEEDKLHVLKFIRKWLSRIPPGQTALLKACQEVIKEIEAIEFV